MERVAEQRSELAPPDFVSQLPLRVYKKAEALPTHADVCAICLEDYVDGEELRVRVLLDRRRNAATLPSDLDAPVPLCVYIGAAVQPRLSQALRRPVAHDAQGKEPHTKSCTRTVPASAFPSPDSC